MSHLRDLLAEQGIEGALVIEHAQAAHVEALWTDRAGEATLEHYVLLRLQVVDVDDDSCGELTLLLDTRNSATFVADIVRGSLLPLLPKSDREADPGD